MKQRTVGSNDGKLPENGSSRYVVVLAIAVTLCCGLTMFGVRAYNKGAAGGAPLTPPPSPQAISPMEVEVVTIRPTGFEPAEIVRPKALFWLVVENRSGLQTIDLRINSADNKLQNLQNMTRKKHDWRQGLDLPAGRYVLTEANHPGWSCLITIQ